MGKGFLKWLSQGYQVANENKWLLGIIAGMLTVGSTVGISFLRAEIRWQMGPVVNMILWDFEKRGVLDEYLKHKAKVEEHEKAFEPRDARAMGYPLREPRTN